MNYFSHVMALTSLRAFGAFAMDCSGGEATAMGAVADVDLSGQTHVLTGGDSGMGYETALALASAKANVILACRSHTKCPAAAARITQATGNKNVSVIPLDLSSFDSVRKCAAAIRKQVSRLDVLINNAGLLTNPKGLPAKTDDGFDRVYQVNFLSAELFVQELLPLLRESGGRVVNVASLVSFYACLFGNYVWYECTSNTRKLSKLARTSPSGPNLDGTHASNYGVAKYLTVFATAELARREPNITAVCLHPGVVATDLIPSRAVQAAWCTASGGQDPCPRSAAQGATTSTFLSVVRKDYLLRSGNGKYFDSCMIHNSVRDNYVKSHGEQATLAYQSAIHDMTVDLIGPNKAVIESAEKHEDIAV